MTPTPSHPKPYDLDRVVRSVMSVATLIGVVLLLRYLSEVLVPFAIALLLAYLLNPTVNWIEHRIKNRPAAVLMAVVGCLLLLTIAMILLVPIMGNQIRTFGEMLTELRQGASGDSALSVPIGPDAEISLGQRFQHFIDTQDNEYLQWALVRVQEFVTSEDFDLKKYAVAAASKLGAGVWGVVTGALSFLLGLTGLIVVLLYVVFLLNDFRLVERSWKEHIPPAYRESLVNFLDEFRVAMSRYFRGQFLVAASVGVLFAVGFSLIGLRMGILLGLFVGMLNMVPYLQTAGVVPATVLAVLRAVENNSSVATSIVLVLSVFAVIQLIQDALLTPRIIGKATGLRPAAILLGVFIWGRLLGFLGLVLAIPLTCLALAYYRRFVLKLKLSTSVHS